jgi:hypothetical protein
MNNVEKGIQLAKKYADLFADVYYLQDQGTSYQMAHEFRPLVKSKDEALTELSTHLEAMEADRVRLLEALKRVVYTVPGIGDGGGFVFDHHSPDGEYLGYENVDPMAVIQEMQSVAMNAIAQSTGETS